MARCPHRQRAFFARFIVAIPRPEKRNSVASSKRESGARKELAQEVGRWGCAACAPRVICFCDRRKLNGVATEPRRAMRLSRQGLAASITEAARLKIDADSSPSRVAPGPILATLGIRCALSAPSSFPVGAHGRFNKGLGSWEWGVGRAQSARPYSLFAIPYSHSSWAFRVSFSLLETTVLILADFCRIASNSRPLR